ncbi:Protein of unknown function (DUF1822) [Rivularia sp. PCC 7116]|uniref:DUF1822 family protein n=1 Tax=Rivularia sp. PCC 7116 TaxID=373994 RepID=UPI00029ED8E2|nr:DUF1822 family protein [Rivularia sp. PCC 7116]AFY56416.1 Protein of unknown function (DUF1822) [Rivularia sp. PCC 7116]
MTCAFADPKEWLLEITPTIQSNLWEQSQGYTTPSSRWLAYINQICLHGFLSWVQTEYALQANVWNSFSNVPAFWEFVNGTAVLLNQRRIVLIPGESIDDSELEVPQEWVDIPSFAADFYLAVQVTPDGEWVRFWGYTTHQELKTLAEYDPVDRTYCMDARHLTKDLNAFWMAYQFCEIEDIKAAIPKLPELSTAQAENMLQRLSNSSVVCPRLEVPFTNWGALLEKEQWRQGLYQQRRGQQNQSSPGVNLSAWLQGIYDSSWQAIDTIFNLNNTNLAFNLRSTTSVKRAKTIHLGKEAESVKVILLVELIPEADGQISIRVQLHPIDDQYLPYKIKLALLTESAETILEVQARLEDNYIQLKLFKGEEGEIFNIQVSLDDYQLTENFTI